MPEVLPALEVVAREVEHERAAHLRHTDAVDAKAGLVLGFSGVLVAVPATRLELELVPGLVLAFVAGVAALAVLLPQRFPSWELRDLRDRYLRADETFARLHCLDTTIVMVDRMKRQLGRKVALLRLAIVMLVSAAAALTVGSIASLGG
jgi:hypothetical protein